ncbi:Golgi transport complex subunit 6 [Dispira simplex]|nr:Golgi transport complex subunit 6 [Dispira simplex]
MSSEPSLTSSSSTGGDTSQLLAKRLQRVLAIATNDHTLHTALDAFTESYRLTQAVASTSSPPLASVSSAQRSAENDTNSSARRGSAQVVTPPVRSEAWLTQQSQQLRGRLDKQTLVWNRRYFESFSRVYQEYMTLTADLQDLKYDYEQLQDQWHRVYTKTLSLVDQTDTLMEQRQSVLQKYNVLQGFLALFNLDPAQEQLVARASRLLAQWETQFQTYSYADLPQLLPHLTPLGGNNKVEDQPSEFEQWITQVRELVGPPFFQVVQALRDIHRDITWVLALPEQRVGNDIQKQVTETEEVMYNILYQWIHFECYLTLNTEEPNITPVYHQALEVLRERPTLWNAIVAILIDLRREAMVANFTVALVGNSVFIETDRFSAQAIPLRSSHAQPLELHAADPLRYIGDMVAWVHQAHASVREWLDAVVPPDNTLASNSPGGTPNSSPHSTTPIRTTEMLEDIVEGLCQPLWLRVSQALQSDRLELVAAFRIFHLLHLYAHLITKATRVESSMTRTLTQLNELAKNQFYRLLHYWAATHANQTLNPQESPDLAVSDVVREMVNMLTTLLGIQQQSLMTTIPVNGGTQTFEQELAGRLVNIVVDPILVSCADVESHGLDPKSRLIYLLNTACYVYIQLAPSALLRPHLETVRDRIQGQITQLEEHLLQLLLHHSKLGEVLEASSEAHESTLLWSAFHQHFTKVLENNTLQDTLRTELASLTAQVLPDLLPLAPVQDSVTGNIALSSKASSTSLLLRGIVYDRVIQRYVDCYAELLQLAQKMAHPPTDPLYSLEDLITVLQ